MEQSPSWQANSHWDSQEFLRILWNPFITLFTRSSHLSFSWTSSIQSTHFHSISLKFIVTLSSHLRLHLSRGLFPFRFSHLSHACYMPRLYQPPWFNHPNNTLWTYKLRSSSLCSLLQPPATFSPLGPNILLSTLFSNILSPSRSVRDQVSHP